MLVLFDCDILSTFAKIRKINLLKKIFPRGKFCYSPSVYQEILKAQNLGFVFPQEIFKSKLKIISLNQKELTALRGLSLKEGFLHLGELESIVVVKNRKGIFVTNDKAALDFCVKNNVNVLDLRDCLKIAGIKKAVSKRELENLIKEIEIKDFTFIQNQEEILEIYKKGN